MNPAPPVTRMCLASLTALSVKNEQSPFPGSALCYTSHLLLQPSHTFFQRLRHFGNIVHCPIDFHKQFHSVCFLGASPFLIAPGSPGVSPGPSFCWGEAPAVPFASLRLKIRRAPVSFLCLRRVAPLGRATKQGGGNKLPPGPAAEAAKYAPSPARAALPGKVAPGITPYFRGSNRLRRLAPQGWQRSCSWWFDRNVL